MDSFETSLATIKSLCAELGASRSQRNRDEYAYHLRNLVEYQTKFKNTQETLNNTIDSVAILERKIISFIASNDQLKNKKIEYENEIEKILKRVQQKKMKLMEREFEYKALKKKFLKGEEKMSCYKQKVEKQLQNGIVYQEVMREEKELIKNKKFSDEILKPLGINPCNKLELENYFQELKSSIDETCKTKEFFEKEINYLQGEVTNTKKQIKQIEQEITIIEKHNAAKLLRLKCQLKKAQERLHAKLHI